MPYRNLLQHSAIRASLPVAALAASGLLWSAAAGTLPVTVARHHAAHPMMLASSGQIGPLSAVNHVPLADPNAAPLPNEDVTAPIDVSDQNTTVKPDVMQIHYPVQGDGYVTGSSAQAMDDRNASKVTGVQLHVPLTNGE